MQWQYVGRNLTRGSKSRLNKFLQDLGFKDINDDLHTTVIYTNQPMIKPDLNKHKMIYRGEITFRLWVDHEGNEIVVLTLDSDERFRKRNREMVNLGGVNNFPEYNPHITITKNVTPKIKNSGVLNTTHLFTLTYDSENYEDGFSD